MSSRAGAERFDLAQRRPDQLLLTINSKVCVVTPPWPSVA